MTARRLSHLNEAGEARMVDVSGKAVTERSATAEGFIAMAPETLDLILAGNAPKGDVLATATWLAKELGPAPEPVAERTTDRTTVVITSEVAPMVSGEIALPSEPFTE